MRRSAQDTRGTQINMVEQTESQSQRSVSGLRSRLQETGSHTQGSMSGLEDDFQATDRGLPIALWDAQSGKWRVESSLKLSAIAASLVTRLLETISGTHGRVNT
ncbi:hypothetical protein HBI60_163650 [Parastagonospora nodorum]|nr:hypothetical protein HBH46_153920 [Parastagonospora nodorum]KAH6391885.1 hypothetical protein HBI60_163650 [Parastagonospora nodorum]KAH6456285.1 hypothetical protein HBI57_127140 [Parastagonospora nodorum]KAH6477081.1 hypothetical protein HBI58_104130 [Parastagonospora nodorum]